ncbi:MAG TPA: DNA repair protein RecO [Gemmatimonadaceae bacterium]|nr:DNA repair protein RecO [Gemmatimonadaceae bacterium]
MPAHSTEAIVLHAFDYLESSRIIKLLTREHGLRSVLARGARSSRKRFGAGLDLFVHGTAELEVKQGRDLDTLTSFDVIRTRGGIGADLARFTGASALAELLLRFTQSDADPELFDVAADTFDRIAIADGEAARDAAIAGAWRILTALGFAPSLDACGECQRAFSDEEPVLFSPSAGGALCETCASLARVGRKLPASARLALVHWASGEDNAIALTEAEARAHRRLLREFVIEHLSDGKPLRAFEAWETGALDIFVG